MRGYEIEEHRNIAKTIRYLPKWIAKEYEIWKSLIYDQGPGVLPDFPGYRDEALKGDRVGQRSSRLNRQYRVIYIVNNDEQRVYVLKITPHKY